VNWLLKPVTPKSDGFCVSHVYRLSQAAQIRLRRQLKLYKQQLQQLMEAEKQARQEANNHAGEFI
jgi:hypothetical protein